MKLISELHIAIDNAQRSKSGKSGNHNAKLDTICEIDYFTNINCYQKFFLQTYCYILNVRLQILYTIHTILYCIAYITFCIADFKFCIAYIPYGIADLTPHMYYRLHILYSSRFHKLCTRLKHFEILYRILIFCIADVIL
jgi:hypothetical protein